MKDKDNKKKGGEDKSRNPEKLNEYIRIGGPGGYILIASLILVVVALIIWGFVGRIPVTKNQYGVILSDGQQYNLCLSFMPVDEKAVMLPEGTEVTVRTGDGSTFDGEVIYMMATPLSSDEIKTMLEEQGQGLTSDWMASYLIEEGTYSFVVMIDVKGDVSEYADQVVSLTIITDEVKPISFLLK